MSNNNTRTVDEERVKQIKADLDETMNAVKAWHEDHASRPDHEPTQSELTAMRELQTKMVALQRELNAVSRFDTNEANNQSTPDELGDAGKRKGDSKPEPDNMDTSEYNQHHLPDDSNQQPQSTDPGQSKFNTNTQEGEGETGGETGGDTERQDTQDSQGSNTIRTILVPDVAIRTPPQSNTETAPPQQSMRSLSRLPPSVQRPHWTYPSREYDTTQVGLVQQSYRSYYGM